VFRFQEIAKAAIEKIKELETPSEKVKAVAIKHHLEIKKKLDLEMEKKMKAITIEYEHLFKPIYQIIGELASGARPVAEEEIKEINEYLTEAERNEIETHKQPLAIKNYWRDALVNNNMIGSFVSEKDEEALVFLTSITYHEEEVNDDYEITLNFAPNEFFTNTTLKCLVKMKDEEPHEIVGTQIEWKEGKNLTKKTITKKQKNKKTKQTRTITKEEDCESFFNIFRNAVANEEDEESLDKVNIANDVGRTIIEEIVPYSLEFFLGIREADYPEDDLEGIPEEDEDEDDDEPPMPKKNNKKKAVPPKTTSPPPPAGQNPTGNPADAQKPECKQQ
jgi:nucleosome assembly protein 1-like 1